VASSVLAAGSALISRDIRIISVVMAAFEKPPGTREFHWIRRSGCWSGSDLRYSPGSLNVRLGEAGAGFEFRTSSGLELRYRVRWESPELRVGIAARYFWWGSLEVAKSFGK
jgi:hypothetical protein